MICPGPERSLDPDPADATSSRRTRPDFLASLGRESLEGFRIGLVEEFERYPIEEEISGALGRVREILEKAGAEFTQVNLPTTIEAGLPCYYILAPAGCEFQHGTVRRGTVWILVGWDYLTSFT
jgi:Asp-tRNA(Asn)/Glu-tRNA(Gln) amidotransferase A subunit family amidase